VNLFIGESIMGWLNSEMADALCTAITMGFARDYSEKHNGQSMLFEYDEVADYTKYYAVQKYFSTYGVNIEIGLSKPQSEMPFIFGLNDGGAFEPDEGKKDEIINAFDGVIASMQSAANKLGDESPKGAYIGGIITHEETGWYFNPVGASSLELYLPFYRTATDAEWIKIKEAYERAVEGTNDTVKAVYESAGISFSDDSKFDTKYEERSLFKSCHGMVRAMDVFYNFFANNDPQKSKVQELYYVEFALGKNTAKVSSCVPCSIFMTSYGKPASSTHLGRGDNWNFPEKGTNLAGEKGKWEKKIIEYYTKGMPLLLEAERPMIVALETAFSTNKVEDNEIPDIFLEALTFEKSFTDRIINVLKK
jgi:hypothetical protein